MKKYLIKLDTYLGLLDARVIQFDQLNSSTCKLEFEMTSNKETVDLIGKRATITIKCPSGAVVEDSILITDATTGKLECILANDMMSEVGMHYGEVCIYGEGDTELFTSANFRYSVSGQLGEHGVKVDTRYSTLQTLIFDVTALKDKSLIDTEYVSSLKDETRVYKEYVEDTYLNATELIANESNVQISIVATEGAKQVNLAKAEVIKATTQADIATQKAQEISSSADQINRSKQELVDSVPSGAKSGQLFFVRKG